MSSPEQLPQGPENRVEAPRDSTEDYERLDKKSELGGENLVESAEKQASEARAEAMENALSVERGGAEKYHNPTTDAPRRGTGKLSKKQKSEAYKATITRVQAELPAGKRAFSKVIHNPVVEQTSEALGSTIARPNAILAGSVMAFVLVLIVFLVANHFGYALSGFETIGAFVAGWIIGLLFDFFKVMITGKR